MEKQSKWVEMVNSTSEVVTELQSRITDTGSEIIAYRTNMGMVGSWPISKDGQFSLFIRNMKHRLLYGVGSIYDGAIPQFEHFTIAEWWPDDTKRNINIKVTKSSCSFSIPFYDEDGKLLGKIESAGEFNTLFDLIESVEKVKGWWFDDPKF